ncbi:MAG: FliI/YscN family ATPase [Desulfovibrionaceae bacterium]
MTKNISTEIKENILFSEQVKKINTLSFINFYGKITKIVGLILEAKGIQTPLGTLCYIYPSSISQEPILAEVVGFKEEAILLMPYEEMRGIMPGSLIIASTVSNRFPVGENLLGRTLDAFGTPIDNKGRLHTTEEHPLYNSPPNPLERPRIQEILDIGVRSINALLTLGKGQRIGIMAGSGVGKSTLLGMMARYTTADVNVIALVGERGREVMEFIEKDLGKDGMARSIIIVATSDQSPLLRMRAAYAATAVSEYFRDQGKDVLLMMDSVTRFAMAGRELGLAIGEPPTTRGYTPSVFAQLPKLLERAGRSSQGSITGIYTVLVDGDDFNEPIADSVRSILDGHIVLTRELADNGHFPAIDVLRSVSRLRNDIAPEDIITAGREILKDIATYKQKSDMIDIGAYAVGTSPDIDKAITMRQAINEFLTQNIEEHSNVEESFSSLKQLLSLPTKSSLPQKKNQNMTQNPYTNKAQ